MRTLYLLLSIYTGLFLSACSSTGDHQHSTKNPNSPSSLHAATKPKDPLMVTVYTHKKPVTAYTVLGKATISIYNPGGIKRQEAYVRDAMRDLAASMGGDAIIDLDKTDKSITGTVIAFQSVKKQSAAAI